MPYTLKTQQIAVKDPDTGVYSGVDILAEQTTEGLLTEITATGEAVKADVSAQMATERSDFNTYVTTKEAELDQYKSTTETNINTYVTNKNQEITTMIAEADEDVSDLEDRKQDVADAVAGMLSKGVDNTLTTANVPAESKATGDLFETIVEGKATQPNDKWNRLWIKPSASDYEIPTMDEFDDLSRQLSDAKSALTESTGSNIIQFIDNYYIKTNLTTGATVDLTPVYNVALAYAVIDVIPGQIIKLNASGWSTGRLWCFIDSDNKLISVSASMAVATDFILVVPENSAKCVLNSYKANVGICLYGIIPDYQIPSLYKKIDNDFDIKLGTLSDSIFELGDIAMTTNGWVWQPSSTRVRIKQNVIMYLKPGDVIGLRDYSAYRYYLGWLDDSGEYHRQGWNSANFTVTQAGRYAIVIRDNPESSTAISDFRTLADLFFGFDAIKYTQENFVNNNDELLLPHDYFVKSVNHRGNMATRPENTFPAFKRSRLVGYKHVETDISFTSDNVPVLMHDDTLNRTCCNASDGSEISGTVYVNSVTAEGLAAYDACRPELWVYYHPIPIPTLKQFMILCRNIGLNPYLELKNSGNPTQAMVESCVDIVRSCGMIDKTTWISFHSDLLTYVKNHSPSSRIGYIVSGITSAVISEAEALKTDKNEVFIDSSSVTDTEVALCINAEIPLESWTVDGKADLLEMNPYVSGITTNLLNAGQLLYNDSM